MYQRVKWVLISLMVIYTVAGFIILPLVVEYQLPKTIQALTKGTLKVDDVDFNPFIGRLDLENCEFLTPENEPLAAFKRLVLDVDPLSLTLARVEVDTFLLDEPRFWITHNANRTFNFSWLLGLGAAKEAPDNNSSGEVSIPRMVFKDVVVHDGRVNFNDLTRTEPYEIDLGPINFVMNDVDTAKLAKRDEHIDFYVGINDGGAVGIKTDLKSLTPLAVKSHISYDSGSLYTQWKYLKDQLNFEVADGKVTVEFDVDLDLSSIESTRISNIHSALNRLRIKPKDGYADALRIHEIRLDGGTIEPLKQRIALDTLSVDGVALFAKRDKEGTIDLAKLFVPSGAAEDQNGSTDQAVSEEETGTLWDLTLALFKTDNIKVTFDDEAVEPHVRTQLDNLVMNVEGITSHKSVPIDFSVNLQMNQTMQCRSAGQVEHSPIKLVTNAGCQDISLGWFDPYVNQTASRALRAYDLRIADGRVGFGVNMIAEDRNGTMGVSVHESWASMDALKLLQRQSGDPLFSLDQLLIEGIGADTFEQKAEVASVKIDAPELSVKRQQDGTLNLLQVAVPNDQTQRPAVSNHNVESSQKDWIAAISRVDLNKGVVNVDDFALEEDAHFKIDRIGATFKDITTRPKHPLQYTASLRINEKGSLQSKGRLQHTPLKIDGVVGLETLPLPMINPYLQEQSFLILNDGKLTASGKFSYAASKKRADLTSTTAVTLRDLAVHDSRDDTKLLAINHLHVNPVHFEYAPDNLFIDQVVISGFYANAVVDANRSFNMAALQKAPKNVEQSSSATQEKKASDPFPIKIVRIKIEESSLDFADYSLPLDFETHIEQFKGDVYNVSSMPSDTSFVELDGVVDTYGSAKIGGSLNAANPKRFTDIRVGFRNLALNNYSPYSAKFAGRKIDDGKLFVELGYKIQDSQMLGENSVVIKKIRLGDDVESPDAVNLPLGLAIALLEDSDGVIDVEMPVEGNVDAPDFKYGTVIWKAFVNMVTNIATAPFRFLGSMLGIEGDALENIEFEPGKPTLLPSEVEKLDALAKAFVKRPRLQLGVLGTYDDESDLIALKREKALEKAIEYLGEEKGKKMAAELDIDVLEALYEESAGEAALEKIQKQVKEELKDDKTFDSVYKERLKSAFVALQPVSEDELLLLGRQRAEAVSTYLSIDKGLDLERIGLKPSAASEDRGESWIKTRLSIEIKE